MRYNVKTIHRHLYIGGVLMYNHIEPKTGGKSMATNRPRYTVSVDHDMFEKIEDFRFENRYQTRAEATVELIRLGLEVLEERKKAEGKGDDC